MCATDLTDSKAVDERSLALQRATFDFERIEREARERKQLKEKPSSDQCWVCSALLSSVDQVSGSRTEISLGSWKDLGNTTCQNHAIVFPVKDQHADQEVLLRKPAKQRLLYLYPDAYRRDGSATSDAPWELMRLQEDLTTSAVSHMVPRPRIIDENWIDIDLLRAWLHECLEHHHDTCDLSKSELSSSDQEIILVDTVQACLVRRDCSCRYLALSYVWGLNNKFLTTCASFQQLCKPGALTEAILCATEAILPRTIDHAIKLTRALGERYIWVDSLCIIQDGSDKTDHLNTMASIFASATLVIVFAQGIDADAGFKGLHGISGPRHAQQLIAPLSPDKFLVRPSSKHVWDDSLLEPWSTRAWTFQESICSRRMLQFARDSVRWCCKKARWSEESESPDCLRTYSSSEQRQLTLSSPQLSKSTLPMLDEYEALVNGFNIRTLTYPEDALSAFAGVSARLGTKFPGGLISGVPEIFFDICLLWRPMRRLGPAFRRRSSRALAEDDLPSWSWAGWETEVSWPYTWNRHNDPAGPTAIVFGHFRPFFRVNFSHMTEHGELVLVNNMWLAYACAALDEQLPSGWSSRKVSDLELQDYGQTEPVSFFRHSADSSAQFWFPVPYNLTPVLPRISSIIHFQTTSGLFRFGETRRLMTRIYTTDGVTAGTLWQHAEDDDDFLRATHGLLEYRCTVELVAILGCTVPRSDLVVWDTFEASVADDPEDHGEVLRTADIYNVMWVIKRGEASYRKATGVVDKIVWESNAKSQVSVNLA